MSKTIEDTRVQKACSARKIALDRGATHFEAMRFALEAMESELLPIEFWFATRGQQ